MATPIEMPRLGNTVEECLLVKWRKQKGDRVAEGEVIADIETDKATFEIAAPAAGISESGSRSTASWSCCLVGLR